MDEKEKNGVLVHIYQDLATIDEEDTGVQAASPTVDGDADDNPWRGHRWHQSLQVPHLHKDVLFPSRDVISMVRIVMMLRMMCEVNTVTTGVIGMTEVLKKLLKEMLNPTALESLAGPGGLTSFQVRSAVAGHKPLLTDQAASGWPMP